MLRPYQHLQVVNLEKNDIRDIEEIMHIPYLTKVSASQNAIKEVPFFERHPEQLRYLQKLHLNQNKLRYLPNFG